MNPALLLELMLIVIAAGELISVLFIAWLSSPILKALWLAKKLHIRIDPMQYLGVSEPIGDKDGK